MKTNFMILLALHLLVVCTHGYSESPRFHIRGRSLASGSILKQTAELLNVSVPSNWADVMGPTNTSGAYGQANVGASTLDTVMANWSLPAQFREVAVRSVRLLVLGSAEGFLVAQAFTFDIPTGTSLTTLLVVATRVRSPVDPDSPFAISYVTINTNAQLKQLQSLYHRRRCFRCRDCFWTSSCCCKNDEHRAARGHTPAELQVVKEKMTADQFSWFNQRNISSDASKTLAKRDQTST